MPALLANSTTGPFGILGRWNDRPFGGLQQSRLETRSSGFFSRPRVYSQLSLLARLFSIEHNFWGRLLSSYSQITPPCDFGKKQPKKKKVAKLIEVCKQFNHPVRNRLSPGFASIYQTEFLVAFRDICKIYAESDFVYPEKQVLILMLDNSLYPCRADRFSEAIVKRLAIKIFV
jgi:hypothetical protein